MQTFPRERVSGGAASLPGRRPSCVRRRPVIHIARAPSPSPFARRPTRPARRARHRRARGHRIARDRLRRGARSDQPDRCRRGRRRGGTVRDAGPPTAHGSRGRASRPAPPLPAIPDARLALPGGAAAARRAVRLPLAAAKGRLTQAFGPTAFGSRVVDGEPFHDGIDLATFCGDRIVAAHDGVVLAAEPPLRRRHRLARRPDRVLQAARCQEAVEDAPDRRRDRRRQRLPEHVRPLREGRRQAGPARPAGDLLGYEGRTGSASGCHLHYGLFSPFERGEIAIDRGVAKRMKLPRAEIARIDPLLVLPPRPKPPAKPKPRRDATGAPAPERRLSAAGSAGR